MALSDEALREAWERAGGQCECTRRTHRHFYVPCGKNLRWEKRGEATEGGWEARLVDAFGGESGSNCEILCNECHGATH